MSSHSPQDLPGPPLRLFPQRDHLLVKAESISKSYPAASSRNGRLRLFENLTFSVPQGEILAIIGPSGAGKSTLLHLLGALDRPDSGEIWCGEVALGRLSGKAAAHFRNHDVGYVWQFHYLLPEFTAAENTGMPLRARGVGAKQAEALAREWLGRVGLADRHDHRAGELSGGEQQRVSLARALITRPRLLLADEPTGDLDGATAEAVFLLLEQLHRTERLTTVLVTHNMVLARRCHRVLRLGQDGLHEVPQTRS